MFADQAAFNEDTGKWDVSRLINMRKIDFDEDISSWNTSAVTNMSAMFAGCVCFGQCGNQAVRQAGLEVLIIILAVSTPRECFACSLRLIHLDV